MFMEEQVKGLIIRKPMETEYRELWSIVESIHKKQESKLLYEDFNINHTKESFRELIEKGMEEERIWVALLHEKIIGFINIKYQAPDYMFFDDKYVYIRYFYMEGNRQEYAEQLIETVVKDAKQYGFEYICGDLIPDDEEMEQLYEKNEFENYRIRLAKKL